MEVYVVIARTAPQDRLYWVIGVYADEARAYQVARDFADLEPMVAGREVDERGILPKPLGVCDRGHACGGNDDVCSQRKDREKEDIQDVPKDSIERPYMGIDWETEEADELAETVWLWLHG